MHALFPSVDIKVGCLSVIVFVSAGRMRQIADCIPVPFTRFFLVPGVRGTCKNRECNYELLYLLQYVDCLK